MFSWHGDSSKPLLINSLCLGNAKEGVQCLWFLQLELHPDTKQDIFEPNDQKQYIVRNKLKRSIKYKVADIHNSDNYSC